MTSDITPHPFRAMIEGAARSIAASIPGVASLGQAWSEHETHRMGERIDELGRNVADELRVINERFDIQEDLIAKCFDQFPSLLEITIEKVRREFSDEKRKRYAHLLARLIVDGNVRTYDEKIILIESLETLTELDINVLKLLEGHSGVAVKEMNRELLGLPGDDTKQLLELACCLSRLESRGLILKSFTQTGLTITPHGMEQWVAKWSDTEYQVLPLGKRVTGVLFE
jgi:hypothetical protein